MKTNTMMRVASVLLVAVLLSTCVISGTFAKYTTSATGSDSARVAKWGIKMGSDDTDAFVAVYDAADDNQVDGNGEPVVAPGTSGAASYKVTGAPETDYEITFDASGITDVVLKAGTYTYTGTGMSYGDAITVANDYYPVKYYITITTASGDIIDKTTSNASTVFSTGVKSTAFNTLTEALAALENVKVVYEAREESGLTVAIDWEWAFTQSADQNDTILGDLAAGNTELTASVNTSSTNVAYTLTMTATQIGD